MLLKLLYNSHMAQQRKTQQRTVIETVLKETDRPLLPIEILELAQQEIPSLGLATVFRAIKDLVAEGDVKPVYIANESPRFESSRGHHHHFKCVDCESVYDINSCTGNLNKLLSPGFELLDHDITLYGRCSDCR